MENVNKFLMILENLKFCYDKPEENIECTIKENIKLIRKYLNIDEISLYEQPTLKLIDCPCYTENESDDWKYTCYLFHILLTIKNLINFESDSKEDLISIKQINLFISALNEVSCLSIQSNLHSSMQKHPIFHTKFSSANCAQNNEKLKAGLNLMIDIFQSKTIITSIKIQSVILCTIAGVYTIMPELKEGSQKYKYFLNYLWEYTSKERYFKNLLLLKSIKELPPTIQQELHQDLLSKLTQPKGFEMLVRNLLPSGSTADEIPNWKKFEVISNIVSHKGHSKKFYYLIIDQIFDFIKYSTIDESLSDFLPSGVISLRKIYTLNVDLKSKIAMKIDEIFKPLVDPSELLTGAIVMDDKEFEAFANLLFTCFCGSSLETLPSELSIKYLPVLINIYSQLSYENLQQKQFKSIIVQCLSNRKKEEMLTILKYFLTNEKNPEIFKEIHPRLMLRHNKKFLTYSVQVVPNELQEPYEASIVLCDILKTCQNNILIYNMFICALNLLDEEISSNKSNSSTNNTQPDLLQDEEELDQLISSKFKIKMQIISFLTSLITYRPFHTQFHENPSEIIDFIKNMLLKRMKQDNYDDDNDEILPIVLAIFLEFIENETDTSKYSNLCDILKKFVIKIKNIATKHQVENIISSIEGGSTTKVLIGPSKYSFAKSLLEEAQPHLRVYGITQLIGLLKEKDEETLSNRHAVLAIALHALRDEESYTYLNVVRLLVSLVNVLQIEVIETLSAEYLNDDEKLEHRLKIGEAILKVTEDLGPISYKYKDALLNCFLHGCKNKSKVFRSSSFSNLATLCRLLSYQIHNFFQELLSIVEDVLQTETYLPARRAAVMVISQLLGGMDNLVDFEDYLLPIYKLLNFIIEHDKDEVTRVHATNGLRYLSEKCKKFLFPEQNIQKEIKIFGIKDNVKESKKGGILEIN